MKHAELIIYQSPRAHIIEKCYICLFFITLLLLSIATFSIITHSGFPKTLLFIVVIILFILFFVATLLLLFVEDKQWKANYYKVTPDAIQITCGVLGTSQRSYGLKGVTSVELIQSPLMKLVNCGTITFKFMGGGTVNIYKIPNPYKNMEYIQQIIYKGFFIVES